MTEGALLLSIAIKVGLLLLIILFWIFAICIPLGKVMKRAGIKHGILLGAASIIPPVIVLNLLCLALMKLPNIRKSSETKGV